MADNYSNHGNFGGYQGNPFSPTSYRNLLEGDGSVRRTATGHLPVFDRSTNVVDEYSLEMNNLSVESPAKKKGTKGKEPSSKKNKKWFDRCEDVFLSVLRDEVERENKPDKNFRQSSYLLAVSEVNKRYNDDYTVANGMNRYKTIKAKWVDICDARDLSGVGWDDDAKMVTMSEESYNDLVAGKSKLVQYINVPIKNYEIMKIVCGEDHAIGAGAKDSYTPIGSQRHSGSQREYVDIDSNNDSGHETMRAVNSMARSISSGTKRKRESSSGKNFSQLVDTIQGLSNNIKDVWGGNLNEKIGDKLSELRHMYDNSLLYEAYLYAVENKEVGQLVSGMRADFLAKWIEDNMNLFHKPTA